MVGVIVRRLEAVVRKPVALFGAPKPAIVYIRFLRMRPDASPIVAAFYFVVRR
jgi:hypothetical protein